MNRYIIVLTIFLITPVFGEEVIRFEYIDNISSGNYVARKIDETSKGKKIADVYGTIVAITVPIDAKAKSELISQIIKESVYVGRVDRKLNDEVIAPAVVKFDDGYVANVTIYGFYLVIDGYYFINEKQP
jgi:hypothetical protein